MIKTANNLLKNIKDNYKELSKEINQKSIENNINDLSINLKHILEDLRSILDYIAFDLFNKYCSNINPNKKIYFPYCNEDKNEVDYIKIIERNFPGLYEKQKNIYSILSSCQHYNDHSKWLIKLADLTNEVKHKNLYIAKVKIENENILNNSNNKLTSRGNLSFQKSSSGYEVFGTGEVYYSGSEQALSYSDGNIYIGNGNYNVLTKEKNNITINKNKIYALYSTKFDEDVISILSNIIKNTENLILKIEKYI